jgi:hypothetical protein
MVELYLYSPICLHGIVLNCTIKYRENFTKPTLLSSGVNRRKTTVRKTSPSQDLNPDVGTVAIYYTVCKIMNLDRWKILH